jgi:hypothetical protein
MVYEIKSAIEISNRNGVIPQVEPFVLLKIQKDDDPMLMVGEFAAWFFRIYNLTPG